MLVLTRKRNEEIIVGLGDEIAIIRVVRIEYDRVRFGCTAVRDVTIHRMEVARAIPEWAEKIGHLLGEPIEPVDHG